MKPDRFPPDWHSHRFQAGWKHGSRAWRGRPGRIFFRFLFTFGFLALLGALLVSIPFIFFSAELPGSPGIQMFWRGGTCLFSILFLFVMGWSIRRIFGTIAAPLGDVMEAADAVASGDLSARVPETGSGSFRQLTQSFNRMATEIESSDQRRRNLTADVAHELRNPLHILQGNLEGILDGVYKSNPEQVQNMLDETRLLTRLVEDLQTLSLAEAGQLKLQVETIVLTELVTDIITSFSGQAETLGIHLTPEIRGTSQQLTVEADYERLQQVLGNLISNALHHTPSGGQVTVGLEPAPSGVKMGIHDTGRGIAAEDLPMIFDRFWKGDRARTRKDGSGSGLGLSISRQLVRAHGGRIEVDSQPGEGTRFTIDLPFKQP